MMRDFSHYGCKSAKLDRFVCGHSYVVLAAPFRSQSHMGARLTQHRITQFP